MKEQSILICLLVFLSVFVPYVVGVLLVRSPKLDKRVVGRMSLPPFYRLSWRYLSAIVNSLGPSFSITHRAAMDKFNKIALMSGWQLTAEHIYAARLFATFAGVAVFGLGFFIISGKASAAVMFGCLGAFLGWVYPVMIVQSRAQKRQREIVKTLPFAIDLIASAMRAGLDFIAAVRHYVMTSGKGALAVEFGLLLRQMELGKSRMEALEEMSSHVQTQEFSAFVGAVAHGTEIGASIIETLRVQGEDMRRARFNLAEQKAARASSIMIFPVALFILPAVFIIVIVPVILRFKAARGG